MRHVELPRALEDYFAHAELARARDGRRFTITLPYLEGARLERFQWWWNVSTAREQLVGDAGIAEIRRQATERFRRHIERWLENTANRLHGDQPIPHLGPATAVAVAALASTPPGPESRPSTVVPWPVDKVARGSR